MEIIFGFKFEFLHIELKSDHSETNPQSFSRSGLDLMYCKSRTNIGSLKSLVLIFEAHFELGFTIKDI